MRLSKYIGCKLSSWIFWVIILTLTRVLLPYAAYGQSLSERVIPVRDEMYRIGILSFMHETCTFCPEAAELTDWLAAGPASDHFLGRSTGYTGGFEARIAAYGGVELLGITSPAGMPVGGTSRSWNSREVWDYYTSKNDCRSERKGPL
jgi:hypothetical protein